MKVKLFYRTQRDLAMALNELVDAYWQEKIKEDIFVSTVTSMCENNQDKLMKNNEFTKVVQQQSGKRRLAVVRRILEMK